MKLSIVQGQRRRYRRIQPDRKEVSDMQSELGFLSACIIRQAIEDYRELESKGVDSITKRGDTYSKEEIIEFLSGEWCNVILTASGVRGNGQMIIDYLKSNPLETQKNKILVAFDTDGKIVGIFSSLEDGARFAKLKDTGGICKCCCGKRKTSGGFSWKYI